MNRPDAAVPAGEPNPYLVPNLSYGFCPGCSHSLVSDALGAALAQLSPDPKKTVLVSDIGCVGLIDKHFAVSTFHGLHGRSITYATGIKLARPELDVIVAIGDGGCGIGGHHLVQAARRGVDITVLVFNNFNYGMTGGEHSSTTPTGARTSSTPVGNDEAPLDLCALSLASGAGFVARVPAFDRELPSIVSRAVRHRGFALLDVWELCTAYFMPSNDFRKSELMAMSERDGMPFGVLRDAERARADAPAAPAPKPVLLEPAWTAPLDRPVGILIAGSAGQKVKSAATSLGRAAIRAGLHATQKDDYPITVKTGHSVAELIVSPKPIRHTGIETPDVALVLTADGLNRTRGVLAAMRPSSVLVAESSLDLPPTSARVVRIDAKGAAASTGRENLVLWAIARMLAEVPSVPVDAFRDTVERFTSAKYRDAAAKAVAAGAGS